MILVAGGTGRLGTRTVRRLLAEGEDVRVLTRTAGRGVSVAAHTVTGDLRHSPLEHAVEGCSTVISAVHGVAGGRRTSPEAVDRDGNTRLIAAARQAGVSRFVLVSGAGAAPDHPMSLHRMKYAAEQTLRSSGLNGLVVRSTSFLETWLGIIGARLPEGGPALVLGPGQNPINFVSADDVAAFVCLAAAGDPRIGEEITVGGPQNLSFTNLAEHLLAGHDGSPGTRHVPLGLLRAASVLARPISPTFARQARAAVVMNTTDQTFDASSVRAQFPDVPSTTLAGWVRSSSAGC
jgi:uncharacterized protein YbjT (DUF2867 family)